MLTAAPATPFGIQIWYWLNCSNLLTAVKPNAVAWADPFWSLAIEEQFYFLWPLLVRRWTDRKLAFLCLAALPCEYAFRLLPYVQRHDLAMQFALPPQFSYRLTPLHTDGIIAGSLLAIAMHRRWVRREHLPHLRVLAIAGAALFCAAETGAHRQVAALAQLRFTGLALFGAGLIGTLAQSNGRGVFARVFSSTPLRMAGKYSFCMYLIHIPVWIAVASVLHRLRVPVQPGTVRALGAVCLTFLVTAALSALSWSHFEEPVLQYKRRFRYAVPAQLSLAQV